jgi:DNA-binding PadR family transcriptional regulator
MGSSMLTDIENHVLAIVLREPSISAYGIRERFKTSIVATFNSSNGTIYPLVKRLADRGLLSSHVQVRNARKAEVYRCTKAGREAVRAWIRIESGSELVLEDPLRTKLLTMSVLSEKERIEWLRGAHVRLQQALIKLEEFGAKHADLEFSLFAHDNARSTLIERIEWIGRTLRQLERAERNVQG